MERKKKESEEKDRTIQKLREDIAILMGGETPASRAPSHQHSSMTITTTSRRKSGNKWWQGL